MEFIWGRGGVTVSEEAPKYIYKINFKFEVYPNIVYKCWAVGSMWGGWGYIKH